MVEECQKLKGLFSGRQSLTMVVGAGNAIRDDNEDHLRFGDYDVVMSSCKDYIDNTITKPYGILNDFNSIFMMRYAKLLKGKFKKIIFDYSTSKFYRGNFTKQFIDMLEPGGQLIIDSTIYMRFIADNNITINNFCEHHGIDINNNTFKGTYFMNSTYIRLKAGVPYSNPNEDVILQNNIKHFENCGAHVEVVCGEYPIEKYVKDNSEFNKQMQNLTYLIVTKPK